MIKKGKKIPPMILVLTIVLLAVFSACGSGEQSGEQQPSSQSTSQRVPQSSSSEQPQVTEPESSASSNPESDSEKKPQPVTGTEESSSPQQNALEDQWEKGDPESARAQVEGWDKVAAAFYQGTSFCPKDEIGYEGGEEISGVFNIYQAEDYDQNSLFCLEEGETVRQRLQLDTEEFGVLLRQEGTLRAEGFVSRAVDKSGNLLDWAIQTINGLTEGQASGTDGRQSLKMTPELSQALEEAGMSPDTTEAVYVREQSGPLSPSFSTFGGLLFTDGTKERFLVTDSELLLEGMLYTPQDIDEKLAELAASQEESKENPETAKPVIYLYPKQEQEITVKLGYPPEYFTYTYPTYEDGWRVMAKPDGTLTNLADGSTHYYLFWEGNKPVKWDQLEGFVVPGAETEAFLREKLAYLGLTPREYNDFITYWVPRMQDNPWNLVTFVGEQYEQLAPLEISPAPDSILRVHMVYQPLEAPVEVREQQLTPFTREGFTVVEWGGSVWNG